jgi:PilZ domain
MDYDPYCRYPASAEALVHASGLRVPIGCVIRNISEGGALVTLNRPVQLPKQIFLALRKGADALECEVRWRRSNRLFGVRFGPGNKPETLEALLKACVVTTPEQHRKQQPHSRAS